jgi:diguanylate cyclase (GGDEF)-like protein
VASAKILVVDDSRQMRDFFAESILRPAGYEVILASDGRAGLRLAQQHRPNLIVADLQMPGLTGLELKKALVAAGNETPLILVTAEGSENIASQATLAGVAYYLPKPVDVEVMLSAIEQSLAVERLQRERAEALSAVERRVHQLETLQSMGHTLTESLNPHDVLNRVLAAAVQLTTADGGRLFLMDDRGAQLQLQAARGPGGTGILAVPEPADALAAHVVRTNQPALYRPPDNGSPPAGAPAYPAIYVPLRSREQTLGALAVDTRRSQRRFTDADVGPLSTLAAFAAIAIANARLFTEVQLASITDGLSGLFNRRHIMILAEREFQRSRRYARSLSAVMLDIDHFKAVNDTYGHAAGDQVITEVAQRLHKGIRNNIDMAGRYGGEEFVLVLPETDLPGAGLLANRLRLAMAGGPVATVGGALAITISAGVATLQPGVPDIATLISNADAALYAAKQAGRNRVAAFGLPA